MDTLRYWELVPAVIQEAFQERWAVEIRWETLVSSNSSFVKFVLKSRLNGHKIETT